MARRGNEAPMDFSWSDGVGPVDAASPFASVARNANGLKRQFGDFKSQSQPPTMRNPASQPHSLFSDANKPLPPRPSSSATNSKPQPVDFTTPRKPRPPIDFDTSGGETPNTPDNNADSEATPGSGMGVRNFLFGAATKDPGSPSPDKVARGRRGSIFKNMFSGGPGRGEIVTHPHNPESRIKKKRSRIALIRKLEKEDTDYIDEDADSSPATNKKSKSPKKKRTTSNAIGPFSPDQQQPPTSANNFSSFFTFLESHPSLPTVLSFYAQLLLNCFIIFGLMYLLFSFYSTIRSDVDEAASHAEAEALTEIALCAKNWKENECDGGSSGRVLPAMQQACKNWERCMERDPKKVGRARVSAHTFARIFNSFIEPISYKAMIFTLILIFGTVAISNLAFGFFRSKAAGPASFNPQPFMYPPATPSRHPSGAGYLENTPYQQWQYGAEPAASQVFGRTPSGGGGQVSPVKKLDFL